MPHGAHAASQNTVALNGASLEYRGAPTFETTPLRAQVCLSNLLPNMFTNDRIVRNSSCYCFKRLYQILFSLSSDLVPISFLFVILGGGFCLAGFIHTLYADVGFCLGDITGVNADRKTF